MSIYAFDKYLKYFQVLAISKQCFSENSYLSDDIIYTS